MNIPHPNGWEEFEDIVKSALEQKWQTSDLTMHGRQGQKQNGIDIYGSDDHGRLVGIQCKLTVNSIDESIINAEICNAENFEPKILSLYIATTSPTDVKLQHYVRLISFHRLKQNKFTVGILFWKDIIQDLTKDINAVKRHYPQLFFQHHSSTPSNEDLRQRDIENVKKLLEYIDIESIPHSIQRAPLSLDADFLCGSDIFQPIRQNPSFYIHDKQLSLTLNSWLDKWYEIIDKGLFTYQYNHKIEKLIFPIPMDIFRNQHDSELFADLEILYNEYTSLLYEFTTLLHQKYPEINLKETSLKARQWHSQFK
jgi:hypothetical protein